MAEDDFTVEDPQGAAIGHVSAPLPADAGSIVHIRLNSGGDVAVQRSLLNESRGGRLRLMVSPGQLGGAGSAGSGVSIPLVQEELRVGKARVEGATVKIHVTPILREEPVEIDLMSEEVEVDRVAMNQPVEKPAPVRRDGDVIIVPVYEEVLVVEKKLYLREEIHIRTRRQIRHEQRQIPVQSERAEILRR